MMLFHEGSRLLDLRAQLFWVLCSDQLVKVLAAKQTAIITWALLMTDSVGGFITMSHLGWRWTQWLLLILGMSSVLLYFVTIPETYKPVVLSQQAKKIRYRSGKDAIQPETNKKQLDLKDLSRRYVLKPWIMIAQEPILALVTLHVGFVFAFLYLCFEAYPVAFVQQRGWNIGVGALPFLAVTIGVLVGVAIIIFHTKARMQPRLQLHGEEPEERLVPMMLGSVLLPMGMFWFGCEP